MKLVLEKFISRSDLCIRTAKTEFPLVGVSQPITPREVVFNRVNNFVTVISTKKPISMYKKSGTDICSDRKLSDSKYADYLVPLSEDPNKVNDFLYHLSDSAGNFRMHFALLKCKCCYRTGLA